MLRSTLLKTLRDQQWLTLGWGFALGLLAMLTVAIGLRDDRFLRHYKYTWALAGIALLIFTFLFGTEVNGARLWIYLGPIGFQPSEFIKIVLVLFIAGYLAEHRALLRDASLRLGPIRVRLGCGCASRTEP